MENTIMTRAAAELWGITDGQVSKLCNEGRIARAQKSGRFWLIPVGAEKPADRRYKAGQQGNRSDMLSLPIGISDYCSASTEYYYVDKILFFKDFLDERAKVSLFTRPC